MDTYSLLREFADSWVLLAMFLFFLGVIFWAFRPGSTAIYRDVSDIPFRNQTAKSDCSGDCDTCACTTGMKTLEGLKDG